MVRDGLMFLSLTVVSLLMAGVTTLLFRSFEAHRQDLANQAAARGVVALQAGRSAEAVEDFRSSLEYRRGDRDTQLALARALAADGKVDQAESYFLNLWQAQPGNGQINLELARVKRKQGKLLDAIQYYRAAVFGTWSGDAPKRRRDIRLELSAYLLEKGQPRAARAELLIASGNNPDAATQFRIAELLEKAGDAGDALTDYRNAAADKHLAAMAFQKITALCYAMDDYACVQTSAQKWMTQAGVGADDKAQAEALKRNAARLEEMSLAPNLPEQERLRHLLGDGRIVERRLEACKAGAPSSQFNDLQAGWRQLNSARNRNGMSSSDALRAQYQAEIFRMEHALNALCGAAGGDDELLLSMEAQSPAIAGEQAR